ncbi:thiamine-phosphate kinase [Neptuniibacter sp.]|uniref:thiamine-phosphate kinase n=1 Tax=Neptuniibacter sp. TaxID=1962643 RepID=UPI00262AA228|nr:thiamine-phosphate kinase [Neptuniibacter sp.]MCP4597211.1 thiamine-phosphate kinase [Neptuniibacter sp.]
MSLGEFELIKRFFAPLTEASSDASVVLGVGDDCAILNVPDQHQLVLSIDTLVEGTHFLPDTPAEHLASRLFGAAMSDLAAMGATPAWLTLGLTLPESDINWLQSFSTKLGQLCREYQINLIGGDTTKGPLALTAQVHGFVPTGKALRRTGAQVDDLICVSGYLGDSRGGLEGLLNGFPDQSAAEYLHKRFYAPSPQIELGQSLLNKASSAIDISDGLLSDLAHILNSSGNLGARLQLEAIPLSPQLVQSFGEEKARQWALTGGEDFELCFTLPPQALAQLAQLPAPVAVIGKVTEDTDLQLFLRGELCEISGSGYDHFRNSGQVSE